MGKRFINYFKCNLGPLFIGPNQPGFVLIPLSSHCLKHTYETYIPLFYISDIIHSKKNPRFPTKVPRDIYTLLLLGNSIPKQQYCYGQNQFVCETQKWHFEKQFRTTWLCFRSIIKSLFCKSFQFCKLNYFVNE